ncbi:MAG: heat-inducible transcriptional repressor HrcA [Firmicutes bacterium]|jgi:heat-inducible transcriptional repressor|nr:heat-inducible transcriptional repressor HrcA [Bacillota bacterium]MCL5066502.1 heat-inducible transcriptional repressor HrcA [Bacillota bacterium]
MDGRKQRVLELLVEDYVNTGEPVGSRTLSRKYQLGVSPATIRNEMADLEVEGYLEHPHTSSGRVPSDKGYRYYVDQLLERPGLDRSLIQWIQDSYRARVRELTWFMHQTAKLVSDITAYPTLVIAPRVSDARLMELSLVPMRPGLAVLVLRMDSGLIESQTIAVPTELLGSDLAAMAAELSRGLHGVAVRDLENAIWRRLKGDLMRHRQFWEEMVQRLIEVADDEERVAVSGTRNMLNYPEFRDVDRLARVLGFFEKEAEIDRLVSGRSPVGIEVMIGAELPSLDIQDCSVVTAAYRVGRKVVGRVLVLGPRRMHYGRVIAVLETVSEELSRALEWA